MDTVLITTTIFNPTVLRRYRQADPNVLFIVAGDNKTPHSEVRALCKELGNAVYLDMVQQGGLGYKCHDIIGPNSIQRRNIALLEAIRTGADVVLSVDDDNAPRSRTYFDDLWMAFDGQQAATASTEWFNLGNYGSDKYVYRGYPFSLRSQPYVSEFEADFNGRVGVVNGLIYGDPDINAIDRYGRSPRVDAYYLPGGVYVNPRTTWTPINSQNTAYVRELAPLAFVLPGIGRYDDIWASYMALRVMEATDYHVYFGEPSVVQERNPHNWIVDLEREIYGMKHTEAFCKALKETYIDRRWRDDEPSQGMSLRVYDNLERVRTGPAADLLPPQTREFMAAWMEDVARVM